MTLLETQLSWDKSVVFPFSSFLFFFHPLLFSLLSYLSSFLCSFPFILILSQPFSTFLILPEPFSSFLNLSHPLSTFLILSQPFSSFVNLSHPFLTFLILSQRFSSFLILSHPFSSFLNLSLFTFSLSILFSILKPRPSTLLPPTSSLL